MPALFSVVNRIQLAVLTAQDQAAALPVSNLADRKLQRLWRSGAATSYFDADFGNNFSIRMLALFGANLASTDTVRHRLSATAAGNGEVLDTGAVACGVQSTHKQHVYLLTAALSARYWRCDIVGTSRAAYGYFDIGRAWAGDADWSPAIDISLGWSEQIVSTVRRQRGDRSGVRFTDPGVGYRRLTFDFDSLSEADRTNALAIDAVVGGDDGQMLFIPDSGGDLSRGPILGFNAEPGPVRQADDRYPVCYQKSYAIEQDL